MSCFKICIGNDLPCAYPIARRCHIILQVAKSVGTAAWPPPPLCFLSRQWYLAQVPNGRIEGDIITDKNLHVGASLSIYGHAFLLHNADEFTLQLMENHRHEYKEADWQRALEAVQAHLNGMNSF